MKSDIYISFALLFPHLCCAWLFFVCFVCFLANVKALSQQKWNE